MLLESDAAGKRCCWKGWPQMATQPGERSAGEALEILREVWRSQGQGGSELDDADGSQKSCKKMADVGFDDFAAGETDLVTAWRAKLEHEGKLADAGGSVRDLVLGPARPAQDPAAAGGPAGRTHR
jgi:hypothetical protein